MDNKRNNKRKNERKELICAVTAVVVLYTAMESIGITCPIKFITGISCVGCGMSRAWMAFLHLDIAKAFAYHPLFWLVPIAVIVLLCKYNYFINFNIYFRFTQKNYYRNRHKPKKRMVCKRLCYIKV